MILRLAISRVKQQDYAKMRQGINYKHKYELWNKEDFRLQSFLFEKERTKENAMNTMGAPFKPKTVWRNLIIFSLFHLFFIPGIHLAFNESKWQTNLFAFLLYLAGITGVAGGAHRLWAHKSYKATWQLKALMVAFFTTAFQGDVWSWARDHRAHHKYTDTDADPYSAARGLWFSHMGWLLQSKHPDVIEKGKGIDMSDLDSDPLIMFHKRHYIPLTLLFWLTLPTVVPVFFWGESWLVSLFVSVFVRSVFTYHSTWSVNSIAHVYGNHPYDKFQTSSENRLSAYLTLGEGWHNYHHAFPWDYSASEMVLDGFNVTKGFIDFFARIGWAYDLKTASEDVVRKRAQRTGDGSHPIHSKEKELWGWGDKDMSSEERLAATIIGRKNVCL